MSDPADTPDPSVPALARLARELRDEGGLLARTVTDLGEHTFDHAAADATEASYRYLLEVIREGYHQHYGRPRVVQSDDADLALLAGDRLYALGLAELARLGDLEATVVLADTISACARAHAEGRPEDAATAWRKAEADVLGRG